MFELLYIDNFTNEEITKEFNCFKDVYEYLSINKGNLFDCYSLHLNNIFITDDDENAL